MLIIGIFSDIHMLALMYGGELCYWAWEITENIDKKKDKEMGVDRCGGKHEQSGTTRDDCASVNSDSSMMKDDGDLQLPLFASLLVQLKGRDYVRQYWRIFSPSSIGQTLLRRYIKVAQGPLKTQNWNYARAVQLVVQLKRC